MMNSGCSASKARGVWVPGWRSTTSCHHRSRPSVHGMSRWPVRSRTRTCSIALSPDTASSALAFTGTAVPRRNWPSVVTSSLAPVSSTRNRSASAENPPNTSECTAPIRAHASVMTIVSTSTGRYTTTRSPAPMPSSSRAFAAWATSRCSCA